MRKLLTTLCTFSVLCIGAGAQELERTVTIDNDFQTGPSDVRKAPHTFAIPDSVRKFDYRLDYSILSTPYKGAYDFSPYRTRMNMKPRPEKSGKLYLNAGAGYSLYPELQAIWNPVLNDKIALTIRQDLNGYCGLYRTVRTDLSKSAPLLTTVGIKEEGYDISENLGVDVRIGTKAGLVRASADYQGLFNGDPRSSTAYNAFGLCGSFGLNDNVSSPLDAEVDLKLSFARDNISHPYTPQIVQENEICLSGLLGPRLQGDLKLRMDYELRYLMRSRGFSSSAGEGKVLPYVLYKLGKFDFRAGLGLFLVDKMYVRPDLRASVKLFGGSLNPYLSVTGSAKSDSYSDLKLSNHWFNPGYSLSLRGSVENIRATVGAKGSVARYFEYDLRGGYLSMFSDALWGVRNVSGTLRSALVYQDYNAWFADARLLWKSKSVEADGTFSFIKTDIASRAASGSALSPLDLPMFSMDLKVTYNYRKRIFVGVTAVSSTDRKSWWSDSWGNNILQSAFFNLGAFAEYRFSSKWSVWIKGINLLNEGVRIDPMHVENGISFTAGFVLNLR